MIFTLQIYNKKTYCINIAEKYYHITSETVFCKISTSIFPWIITCGALASFDDSLFTFGYIKPLGLCRGLLAIEIIHFPFVFVCSLNAADARRLILLHIVKPLTDAFTIEVGIHHVDALQDNALRSQLGDGTDGLAETSTTHRTEGNNGPKAFAG